MQDGKVKIADGTPETRDNLHLFLRKQKKLHPERNMRTLGDAIDFAIEQAERVPALEQEIKEKDKRIEELEEVIDSEFPTE